MARNDQGRSFGQGGRSLEEQLASLDALNSESTREDEEATAAGPEAEPAVPPNPWLNHPPEPPSYTTTRPPDHAFAATATTGNGEPYPPPTSDSAEPTVERPPLPGNGEADPPPPVDGRDTYAQPPPPGNAAAYPRPDHTTQDPGSGGPYAPPVFPPPPGFPPPPDFAPSTQFPPPYAPPLEPLPEPGSPEPPARTHDQHAPLRQSGQQPAAEAFAQPEAYPRTAETPPETYEPPAYGPPAFPGQQPYMPPDGYAQHPPGAPPAPPLRPSPPPSVPSPQQQQLAAAPQTADNLSPEMLLRGRRHAPAGGWRKAVYKASGGLVHPGESPGELRRRELEARARTPVAGGHHRVAVLSLKGGVGKTTTTVGLGATLSALRGDRVIAVDANPDRGTLSDKVRLETAATVRDLLNECGQIQRYADVRSFTSQAPSRLEVLASDRDPAVSEAFSEDDYRAVTQVLEHFYSVCLTDCGTGLLHSAMAGVLGMANQIVLVSSPSVDGARSASATLDWLEAHHYGELVRNAVVVLSAVRSKSKSSVDIDRLEHHFATRSRAVVRIPYDGHLEEGAEIELEQLNDATQDAYLVLAATVGDGFAWSH